jgi:ElaB/YqjD/DUF883 family membrane-anchored ribosome-binding protein
VLEQIRPLGHSKRNLYLNKAMNTETLIAQLKQKAEELVKRGKDVREETSRLVSEASGKLHQTKEDLSQLVKAVADGAIAGAKQTLPEDNTSVLSSVVHGITDGLTTSAQAIKLTLEESTTKGTRFAKEDLGKIADDFKGLGGSIADIIKGSFQAVGGHAKEQAQALGEHAKQTLQTAWPSLESALHSAAQEPVKLGSEAVKAGTAATRQAAGVLFSELGRYLQQAGDKLRQ